MDVVSTTSNTPVTITLLLAGGHQYTLPPMDATHPMLKRLFNNLTGLETTGDSGLFEMEITPGEQAFYFSGKNVVGLFASPPVQLQAIAKDSCDRPLTVALPYQEIPDVLRPAEHESLLNYVTAHREQFATVTPNLAGEYRNALMLEATSEIGELVWRRIQSLIPKVCSQLQCNPSSENSTETHVLAHNHGHFSSVHRDDAEPGAESRMISWLYYFYQEPRSFSGGELLLYDNAFDDEISKPSKKFQSLTPRNNSVIFFPSSRWYALMPVYNLSQVFEQSQFILKGWISHSKLD